MSIGNLVAISSHGLFSSVGGSCDYPVATNVRNGVTYAFGGLTGNLVLPAEDDVLEGINYGAHGTEFTGTFSCNNPPSPATVGDMPFSLILANIVNRVSQALGIGTDFIRPVANDDYAVTEAENLFSYIRPYGPSPVDPTTGEPFANDGAGRWRRVVGRRVRIYLYTRSGVDVYGGDEIALMGNNAAQVPTTPPTMPGAFALEELLLNAMDDWQITYTDGLGVQHPLTVGPIHWIDSADGPPLRKAEDEEGLVRSHLDFQVVYTLVLQRVEPAPSGLPVPNAGN